jgi:Ca2+-binding EF-hand superfamily protein
MKLPNPLLPFAAVLALTIPAVAQDAPTPAAQERGPQPNRVELIRQFDKNGDGILDETERQAAREAALQGRPQRPAAQNAERSAAAQEFFRRLDKNGDGKIDEAERAAARAELAKRTQLTTGSNLTAATAGRPAIDQQAVLKEFDKDGDGQLSDSEREAAMQAMRNRLRSTDQRTPPNASREDVLKRFDTNGDGQIDEAERAAAREAVQRRNANGRYHPEVPAPATEPPASKPPVTEKKD